ncbi:LPS export ABC transporter permease LptF [Aliamphritea hakodatensis]|uniref:LPS export ABC transporter permease LptF n=1 Tax=Aliamphritea hakodatensis TaxID=2895352 RepID=UPI0022FD37BC|nr:LPS export ABC transporter permease LptF [Aliamphritea hakodatensis]
MIIFRYISREVLLSMSAVSGVLLLIIMSGRFIRYLTNAAAGKYSVDTVFQFMLYRMPGFLELILPLGLFLGILLAYGRLYLESEMAVLKATGMSQRRLSLYTLGPATLVAAVVAVMSLWLTPAGVQKAETVFQQSQQSTLDSVVPGRFQEQPDGFRSTYIEMLNSESRRMEGIFVSETIPGQPLAVVAAETGRQVTDPETGARYLVLENGFRYEGQPGEAKYREIQFEEYGIRLPEADDEPEVSGTDMATTENLFGGTPEEVAQLHWRISLPVMCLIVALLAVPLSKTNPRQGRFAKLIPSILLYLLYLLLLTNTRTLVEDGDAPVFVMWVVHLAFFGFAMSLLFAGRFWEKLGDRLGIFTDKVSVKNLLKGKSGDA